MNDLPETLDGLTSRIEALEKRLQALEQRSAPVAPPVMQPQVTQASVPVAEGSAIDQAGSVAPVLGKAMLGIAGAYVLRAVADSGPIPRSIVAAAAIAYAIAWLVGAVRSRSASPFARAIYAGASALILAPMLWELTLSFQVLSPALAAAVLCGFVALATVLTHRSETSPVFWVAQGSASIIAVTLSIATHHFTPFLVALLLMVVLCEYAAARNRGRAIRIFVALAADASIWVQLFIYSGPQSAREVFPAMGVWALIAPACILFLICAVSVATSTLWHQRKISSFETLQCLVAILLTIFSVLFFAPQGARTLLGLSFLALSAACYATAFGRFRRGGELRNFRVFSAWSAGLLMAGLLWTLPGDWAAASLGAAALLAVLVGVRQECLTLDFHGVLYLVGAAVVSGQLSHALHVLAGPLPDAPGWTILLVSACAVLCYAAGKERAGEDWQHQILHFVPALVATFAVAALMVQGLLRLLALFLTPDVFHVAFIRTLTVCAVALVAAYSGARWRRLEMTRIAYVALAFEAAKLVFEDLQHGRMSFIAASFFLFAVTLIVVPRLMRAERKP